MPQEMDNPGSAAAVGRGCTCDLIKNDFGRGYAEPGGVAFYCAETCPLHGVLLAIANPTTDGPFTYEPQTPFKWLKSRIVGPFKRRP
jgi:hypothetical protein